MVFQCQKDSFLKEYTTKIESVNRDESGIIEVTFERSIFFPEGKFSLKIFTLLSK